MIYIYVHIKLETRNPQQAQCALYVEELELAIFSCIYTYLYTYIYIYIYIYMYICDLYIYMYT